MPKWSLLVLGFGLALMACTTNSRPTADSDQDPAPTSTTTSENRPTADSPTSTTTGERPGGTRQPVELLYEAYVPTLRGTSVQIGVASCNGDPSYVMTESDTEVRVAATSWIPSGNDRDDCLDGIVVELEIPLGDRAIIDELTGREVPVLTDEILNTPDELKQIDCAIDSLGCLTSFYAINNIYDVTCMGVLDEGVSPDLYAVGELDGVPVEVFQIKSVGVNIMVAVNLPSGNCEDVTGVETPWSVALRNGRDPEQLSSFLCGLAALSPEQRDAEQCERFE